MQINNVQFHALSRYDTLHYFICLSVVKGDKQEI